MTQAYTRDDMARALAEHFQVPKRQGQAVVNFIFEKMLEAVKEGRKVSVPPMGSFQIVERKGRRGLNPQTKKVQSFPGKPAIRFRPSARAELS